MRVLASLSALSLAAVTATAAMAQTPASPPARPVVKTTCSDYIGMQETVKPQFIYFAVGHGKKGGKDAVFEEGVVEKIKPELDQYCSVHLTHSAYEKVLAASMASEPAGAAAPRHSTGKHGSHAVKADKSAAAPAAASTSATPGTTPAATK